MASFLLALIACGCHPIENYTDAEKAALADRSRSGRVRIALRDAVTGRPIAECGYGAFKFSTDPDAVDRRLPIMVHGRKRPPSPDGNHEFELAPGWYRLRLSSERYRFTWTPTFEVVDGRTTSLDVACTESNRIRVTVIEGDGCPCPAGTLLLLGPGIKATLIIRDGLGEALFDEDDLRIRVDPGFMPGYRSQAVDVLLEQGKVNEIVLQVEKA